MFDVFLAAAFGAALQELLHWAELRNRLSQTHYGTLLRSRAYWITVILLIPATGIGAVFWYAGLPAPALRDAMLMGAALPALFKKAVAAKATAGSKSAALTGMVRGVPLKGFVPAGAERMTFAGAMYAPPTPRRPSFRATLRRWLAEAEAFRQIYLAL